MQSFSHCKNILCIRPDNMGDLLMSSVAINAIKTSFNCKITVLVSEMATEVAQLIPAIDEVIVFNSPWVALPQHPQSEAILELITQLKQQQFDGGIVFNVYSQNPVPGIMLAYLAAIPLRAAYCRENIYGLLTHWLPDQEPYGFIKHQVERDLALAEFIGAKATAKEIRLNLPLTAYQLFDGKLGKYHLQQQQYLVVHVGASDAKRNYPAKLWEEVIMQLKADYNLPILLTGTNKDQQIVSSIVEATGSCAINLAGCLNLGEFAVFLQAALVVITVNTGTAHLCAAVQTPLVVLHAQTNPQHSPWMVSHKILPFSLKENQQSKNQVIQFVNEKLYQQHISYPAPAKVVKAVKELLAVPVV